MDTTENHPSLINCLATANNGFLLDLALPSGDQAGAAETSFCISPFSKTIHARIKTDGGGVIQHVLLTLQRDQYDAPRSLLPINNIGVETAWQNAFIFHQRTGHSKAPIFFKHQINPKGKLEPFQPLFHCHQTKRWFHPVCPQCGTALMLCRDDARLEKRGLPTYADSLDRFLYCGSCATLSDSSPFYSRKKTAGMPDSVHDAGALVNQWKQLLANLPDGNDLPCRGCPEIDACFGPERLASKRIEPFSFFPFFMMMFPAPSCRATDFLPMISGDTAAAPSVQNRFLFQDQDRLFLEILYLKLTFLEQVHRQLMPTDGSTGTQEFALSLDGIGVDLNPAGAGLPAYWNFNVRILDAIGTFQASPFAPIMPEAPRLHFLGAIWFRTLLVNSRQRADSVYAEVGRMLDQLANEKTSEALEIATSDPVGVFAGSQNFWVPDQLHLPENWIIFWKEAMRLGFLMVHAGLRTGVFWDNGQFRAALGVLRKQIKDEMFSGPVIASTDKVTPAPPDMISLVLHGILEKWQTDAEPTGIQPISDVEAENLDIQETVIFSSADSAPPSEATKPGIPEPPAQPPPWIGDIEETVVLRTESATPPPEAASPVDNMDRTIVISPLSTPSGTPLPGLEEDLAATMIQNTAGAPPSSSDGHDEDLEATVVLNGGGPSAPKKDAPPPDDDLAATMVQGTGGQRLPSSPRSDISSPLPSAGRMPPGQSGNGDDLDATVIIKPASQQSAVNDSPVTSPGPEDDDLAATLIETPRSTGRIGIERPRTENSPPPPPTPPPPPPKTANPPPRDLLENMAVDNANDDDDIMEETIIIRSNVKKE